MPQWERAGNARNTDRISDFRRPPPLPLCVVFAHKEEEKSLSPQTLFEVGNDKARKEKKNKKQHLRENELSCQHLHGSNTSGKLKQRSNRYVWVLRCFSSHSFFHLTRSRHTSGLWMSHAGLCGLFTVSVRACVRVCVFFSLCTNDFKHYEIFFYVTHPDV